jgi:ATP-binding cassette subfamily B protein
MNKEKSPNSPKKTGFKGLLKPYLGYILLLALLSMAASSLGLILPKIIAATIDGFVRQTFNGGTFVWQFGAVTAGIFGFTYLQSIVQTLTSERVARDLRSQIADKISRQSPAFIEKVTSSKLLTNLTSDIDSIKMFIGMAIASLISSIIIVLGAGVLMFMINWRLALVIICVIPIIGIAFFVTFRRVRVMMKKSREVIDWLNKVINESILGSALIRVLNSQQPEFEKFIAANTNARNLGLQIVKMFASLIPVVTFVANLAILSILVLGGNFVIGGSMSLGDFTAFNSYISLLIFPILVIGIMGNVISQAAASYDRIAEVLDAKEEAETGTLVKQLKGEIEVEKVSLKYGEKPTLKYVSLSVAAGSKTAIIGPTAAGKTQLLNLLIGLKDPDSGVIRYDGHPIREYDSENLHRQIGFVFQDSIIFNLTLRESIAFGDEVNSKDLEKAIETAELKDFIEALPEKLETVIAERGTSLSGGQKQRIMLARALSMNPRILLLDDFTARVDNKTEARILANLAKNYPELTLVSVTQKISSIEKFDQIILLMEGEILARGKHRELLESSPEYVQIYNSQKSTQHYE